MIEVERNFKVNAPRERVIDYLKDFAHAVEWDPGTKACEQTSDGPVSIGTTWHNVSEFKGRETDLTYRLVGLEPDAVHLMGENDTVTSYDDISVTDAGTGSHISYRARLDFHGLAKLASPFLQSEFEDLGDKTQQQLTEILNRL